MAKSPVYEPGSIQPRPLPAARLTARATSSAFGAIEAQQIGRIGAALLQVSDLAGQLTVESQDKTNKALARDGYNRANTEANHRLATEVYSLEGVDAVDAYIIASTKLEEVRKTHAARLKNERQKELFNASFDALKVGHLNRVIGFQEKQRDNLERVTIETENLQSIEMAVDNRTDPEAIRVSEGTIVANTKYLNRSFSKKIRDQRVAEATDLLYSKVLEALTVDSPGAALAFFEKNKDKFNRITRVGIVGQLNKLAEAEIVRETAIALSSSGIPLEDQLKTIDKEVKNVSAAGLQRLRSMVKERDREKKLIADANAKKTISNEWGKFKQDPRGYQIPKWLPVKEQELMEKRKVVETKQWAYERGAGPAPVTDWPNFNNLMSMTPEELTRVPMRYWGDLAPAEWNKVLAHLGDSRSGSGSAKGKKAARIRTMHQQFGDAISGMSYFDPKKKSQPGRNVSAEHKRKREGWYYAEADTRRALIPEGEQTTERIDKLIAEDLLADVTISRGFGRAKLKIKKFEIPYLSDVGFAEEEAAAALEQRPKVLKKHTDLQYDFADNVYFLDIKGGTERDVFDRVSGAYITTIPISDVAEEEDFITITVGGE